MIIVPITDNLKPKLRAFCQKSKDLGYENNASLDAMKFDWCQEIGKWFCAIEDEKIIAVALLLYLVSTRNTGSHLNTFSPLNLCSTSSKGPAKTCRVLLWPQTA